MPYKYSFSDFTTKGHGVIEYGYAKKKGKSGRKKAKKSDTSKSTNTLQDNLAHLTAIHRQAQAERNYPDPAPRIVVPPKKKKS